MSRVPDIEYSALQMLIEGEQRATEHGATLWLAGLNPGVLEVVRRSGLADRLGRERLLFNARAAIERFLAGEEKAAANQDSHQADLRCTRAEVGRGAPSGSHRPIRSTESDHLMRRATHDTTRHDTTQPDRGFLSRPRRRR